MHRQPLAALEGAPTGCQIERIDASALGRGAAWQRTTPALLTGASVDALRQAWAEPAFVERFGHFSQSVKNEFVRPVSGSLPLLSTSDYISRIRATQRNLLLFTNNVEHPDFMGALAPTYKDAVPEAVAGVDGFEVFSVGAAGSSHTMHHHGESWLLQVHGRKLWWFMEPGTPAPPRVNACSYIRSGAPKGSVTCLQQPGEVMVFPKRWLHATCMLDDWAVGVGAQAGRPSVPTEALVRALSQTSPPPSDEVGHRGGQHHARGREANSEKYAHAKWFSGNVGAYYDSLEQDIRRSPTHQKSLATHRWLGANHSTLVHYELIHGALLSHVGTSTPRRDLRVADAGCGVGGALVWFEAAEPGWTLQGFTLSAKQHHYATKELPRHKFEVSLKSYDDLEGEYDAIYSIEALVHTPSLRATFAKWSEHLRPGGVVVLIDDYYAAGAEQSAPEKTELFRQAWLATSATTPAALAEAAASAGLDLVANRDIGAEYEVVRLNYNNKAPPLPDARTFSKHQGWLGGDVRRHLTVKGLVEYRMLVLRKPGGGGGDGRKEEARRLADGGQCAAVETRPADDGRRHVKVAAQLMDGHGDNGGKPMACLSSWYCCGKGPSEWETLQRTRTHKLGFLDLPTSLFGDYMEVFARRLSEFHSTHRGRGRFLDIGGTGSTVSGMVQVQSKFKHFAGRLDYWVLDVDEKARELSNAIVCNVENCPAAADCSYDVTFSHTVLEHAARPWLAFDTISRITKKGGLTLHLVPWSYQYHATPADHFRFSHDALRTLLTDRGFEVLEVGYDLCTRPAKMARAVDEHYEKIWLSYVVGRKL